ncbi:hypothetical protein WH96_06265 [Kiloniella spongiae]|uniref:Uncharacterized protein n=1 Tax=Kiloniella spongiae TaxID=1489064 RepID=A0A0H2MI46_9PROT|nr:hypothetical protein [Kiloniella spongiae]KLN61876.1 hypothetical protein WH96_06265 [Kiloniella spongiae]
MTSFATCKFFDDCRTEVNGKKTYIGGYGNDLIAGSLPIKLNTLWVQLSYGSSVDAPELPVRVNISIPGKTDKISLDLPVSEMPEIPKDVDVKAFRVSFDFPIFDVVLSEQGRIVVEVETENQNVVRAGVLKITSNSSPDANSIHLPHMDIPELIEAFSRIQEIKSDSTSHYKNITSKIFDEFLCQIPKLPSSINKEIRLQVGENRILVFFEKQFKEIPSVHVTSLSDDIKFRVTEIYKYGFSLDIEYLSSVQDHPRFLFKYET